MRDTVSSLRSLRHSAHLWIEVIDTLNSIFHISALHSFADLHAVCDGRKVDAWLRHGLLLEGLCCLHIPL